MKNVKEVYTVKDILLDRLRHAGYSNEEAESIIVQFGSEFTIAQLELALKQDREKYGSLSQGTRIRILNNVKNNLEL